MKKELLYHGLSLIYFPFQLMIFILLSPLLVGWFAMKKSEDMAFEDVYMTKGNPMVNQEGPTMKRKREHCWLVRFVCPCF